MRRTVPLFALLAASALAGPAVAQPLNEGFQNPPPSARPRVWWHWLNGNVTRDGIDRDLDWMARMGIGGVQNFDANLATPQIVDKRLVYMQPDWKEAFRHAVIAAEQKGLEFTIASSPGWSETGGPWVPPEDGMKKLVWSQTNLPGGQRFNGKLADLPHVTGPFQNLPSAEPFASGKDGKLPEASGQVAVLAVPWRAEALPVPHVAEGDARSLTDDDLQTGLDLPLGADGTAALEITYDRPVSLQSLRLFVHDAQPPFAPPRYHGQIEAWLDGAWQKLGDVALSAVPGTVAFRPVTAARFRLVIATTSTPPPDNFLGSVAGAEITPLFPSSGPVTKVRIGELRFLPGPVVHQAEAKAGFATVPDYAAIDTPIAAQGVAPDDIVDLTGRVKPDGTLDWTPPAGKEWRVMRFGWSLTGKSNHPATAEATGLEVDKYDAEAVERYMRRYLALYRDAVGSEWMGAKGIRAILTDSIEVGASNWTPHLMEEFRQRRGYDPLPFLPALTGIPVGSTGQSDQFLHDFRQTLADLMAQAHYGTVARVAHENGLKVYGEALEAGRPVLGDDMAMRSHADVPMAALWAWTSGKGPRGSYLGDMRGAASVAHFYGQNLVAAESMTSAYSPWAFAPADLKPVVDLEFASGVNRPIIHTSVHQPEDTKLPGLSLGIFGQYFNRHESWAEMARPWVDYIARSSYLLQQGRFGADIALFNGEDTPVTTAFSTAIPKGLPRHYGYDFLNAEMLGALKVEGTTEGKREAVSPGGVRYRAIMLGGTSRFMTIGTLRRLKALVEAGVPLIGDKPLHSPGLGDDPASFAREADALWNHPQVMPGGDIEAAMERLGITPDWQALTPSGADLQFVHRILPDGDIYFVSNPSDRTIKAEVALRAATAPQVWNPRDGSAMAAGARADGARTIVSLDLAPHDSRFVVFGAAPGIKPAPKAIGAAHRAITIATPWRVRFAGLAAPAPVVMPRLVALEKSAAKAQRYFSGTITYDNSFILPRGQRPGMPLRIDLGRYGDVAQVLVNGRLAGTVWFAGDRVDIGAFVRKGRNELRVRVTNLWVNRLIGDAQPGARPVTWTAVPTYRPDAPLRPSGLIGPVRILSQEKP
ncbi:glycosyl hydrolase [Novosphingobium humi]|uniref:Glycosyl hydrolase n=1 Tax=Novosphingobium humi TaxID=2282397 RepID=A0ABY7U0Y1_9SPHN|nr:glycosyl hydrolase [Novosphingobium humi]WCT79189.1 glycosyl hydrolase [Novosphingobium humi]